MIVATTRARNLLAGVAVASVIALSGCNDGGAEFDRNSQIGSNPFLPAPKQYLVPPIHVAEVVGWSAGQAPTAAAGLRVQALAREQRWF